MGIDNRDCNRPSITSPILSKDLVIMEALDKILENQKEMREELQYIRSQRGNKVSGVSKGNTDPDVGDCYTILCEINAKLDSHILWMNFKDDPKLKQIFEDFQKDKLLIIGDNRNGN